MDRKHWLTLVYREANLFIERREREHGPLSVREVDALEPELHAQLREVIVDCEHLEDLVKFSVLRDPPSELWKEQARWEDVLAGVAAACFAYDVQGVLKKILAGDLPRLPSSSIHEAVE